MRHHRQETRRKNAMWQPNRRYPDPDVVVMDKSFARYKLALASIEHLHDGCRWSEGPVWFGDGRFLLWSDIPNNRILKWEEETGAVSVFRAPSHNANGNTRDRQGRLITCEHDSRRVTRTEMDGAITVLAEHFQGRRLNSPNDVVVKSDGTIWFTDPVFGILGHYEGHPAEPELAPAVWRFDPATGALDMVADDVPGPNGLAFSPDESILYVVASRAEPRDIRAFDVIDGRRLARGRIVVHSEGGTPDGFRVDVDGNLWCGWGMGDPELDGVRVFNPAGVPIGHIRLPERCANLCFGGRHRNRLFMAASHGLYSLYVNTQGVAGG
ncbi:MAG: SMP-30/gluconolactonase/LRE family protein [Rhodospirillales bacterium]|nr:SMP-30/gluconolactonase/LRE family protein [Rhodospirillales bacterium]MDE2200891.1 SMP-30/gluconolactonase/LRE family protein [Rhodospirillales bacterium]MDE2575039.1 SMP-30/gluconolactonase/LRE family protein [Rhodospirillales bacterium]